MTPQDLIEQSVFRRWRAGCRHVRARLAALTALAVLAASLPGKAQAPGMPDFSRNPEWFPRVLRPYQSQPVPAAPEHDELDLSLLARDGKLRLSLGQLRAAVLQNHIDIASARYGAYMADTDILRARGGGAPRGAPGVRIPSGLFAGAIGAGVGDTTTAGGGTGAGGITGSARQVVARPRGSYDPSLALNFSLDRTTSPLNTIVVAGVPTVTTSTTALQARYAQAFTAGTTISISFNNQRQSSTQRFLRYNPAFVSSFSFIITQQLLNGFGFDVNRRFLTVAENGRKIAQEMMRQQVLETLSGVESIYWDLVAARENVRVTENALAVARQMHEDNREREAAGALAGIDVVTAASEVSARQRDLIAAQTVMQQREADLKASLTRRMTDAVESARIEPADDLPDPRADEIPVLTAVQAEAIANRPELRQAELDLLNQEVAIRYTRNLLRPTFLLFGMLNSAGLYGTRTIDLPSGDTLVLPGGLWGAINQVGRFDYPEYAFGFTFQLNIRNRSAQADSLRARLEQRQSETSLQRTRTRISLEVRNAVVALVQSRAQAEAAAQAVELQRQTVRAEEERLRTGLSTPYEVIRRQRDLIRAQFEDVRARTDYAKARLALERATGKGADIP
jgi:outer membrane protein TolC